MLNIKLKTKQKNCSDNIPIKNCDKPKKTPNEYMQITKDSKKKYLITTLLTIIMKWHSGIQKMSYKKLEQNEVLHIEQN